MDGRETQLLSFGTKRGGWITLPFIIGQPLSLSLSLSLSNTHRICLDQYISYFYLYQEGAAAGFTLGGEGWISNLIVYLIQVFTLKNINAAQISNIVSGIFLISIYIKKGRQQASHLEAGDGFQT